MPIGMPRRTKIGKDVPRRTNKKLEKTYQDVPRTNWKKCTKTYQTKVGKTYQHVPRRSWKQRTKNKLEKTYQEQNWKRRIKTYQEQIGKLGTNVKILVHAQDSCACTTLLCMHNTLVHALEGPGPKAGVRNFEKH